MQLFTNNADSVLDGAILAATTSLTVTTGHGAKFPAPTGGDHFLVTLYTKAGTDEIDHEIVKCTARTGDLLTLVRAQEGTTARDWPNGAPVELRLTSGSLDAKEPAIPKVTGYAKWTGTAWSFVNDTYQPQDADLSAIAALAGATGLLRKTAANTWALDTTAYTANTGTVTSIGMTVPTGLSLSGSPITTSGTFALTLTAGYSIPTTANQTDWATAYGWGNHASAGYVTATGAATLTNKTLTSPVLGTAPEISGSLRGNIVAVAALAIDCSLGNYFTKTIAGASTLTFTNVPAARAYSFTLELTHTSGAITWPTSVQWPDGLAPSLTTAKTHLFMFVTDDGGTRWRGAFLANYTT